MEHPDKLVANSDGSQPSVSALVELWRETAKETMPDLTAEGESVIDFLADYCILNNTTSVILDGEEIILTLPTE